MIAPTSVSSRLSARPVTPLPKSSISLSIASVRPSILATPSEHSRTTPTFCLLTDVLTPAICASISCNKLLILFYYLQPKLKFFSTRRRGGCGGSQRKQIKYFSAFLRVLCVSAFFCSLKNHLPTRPNVRARCRQKHRCRFSRATRRSTPGSPRNSHSSPRHNVARGWSSLIASTPRSPPPRSRRVPNGAQCPVSRADESATKSRRNRGASARSPHQPPCPRASHPGARRSCRC